MRMSAAACSRLLAALLAIVLFAGMFAQVTMLSRISEKRKRASKLQREIARLNTEADNLELAINQYHNLEQIALLAQQMGMEQPDETQIRVLSAQK